MLVVSHDASLLASYADRILTTTEGRLTADPPTHADGAFAGEQTGYERDGGLPDREVTLKVTFPRPGPPALTNFLVGESVAYMLEPNASSHSEIWSTPS